MKDFLMPGSAIFLTISFLTLLSFPLATRAAHAVDWSQPQLKCVEQIVPAALRRSCPDFSGLTRPEIEFPPQMGPKEIVEWEKDYPKELASCRALGVLQRERLYPGAQGAVDFEKAQWLAYGPMNSDVKTQAIYDAANEVRMPPEILAGALKQESLLAEIGLDEDGGNFSCGIAQLNLHEWCSWADQLSAAEKQNIGWPETNLGCAITLQTIGVFRDEAVRITAPMSPVILNGQDFARVSFDRVRSSLPGSNVAQQKIRFEMVQSFLQNCMKPRPGIRAKAHVLRDLFQTLPSALQGAQSYRGGDAFRHSCIKNRTTASYPVHVGWLLADAFYNAGARALDKVAHYEKWDRSDLSRVSTWDPFTPQQLIDALYFGGSYVPSNNSIRYRTLSGKTGTMTWFKSCVLARHIWAVVNRITPEGIRLVTPPPFTACDAKGLPPLERQNHPGVKP